MKKRNPFAKSLFTSKYKPRKVKPKKGKGSFKRKKISNLNNLR
jgi:stalled ribosome alternative rescue factor ArfA|tara:strand:- start:53 stop:181 length:129 start_codon:yes stop_codon:yes gene_type:complete